MVLLYLEVEAVETEEEVVAGRGETTEEVMVDEDEVYFRSSSKGLLSRLLERLLRSLYSSLSLSSRSRCRS